MSDGDDDDDVPPVLVTLDNDENVILSQMEVADAQQEQQPQQPERPVQALPPCPVTILSGFLGSGKTTLIQYILRSPDHGKRIAVIENEFGEGLSVESLIARDGVNDNNGEKGGNSLQDLIELPNGCICCTVKDSLVQTLEALIDKRHDLDYILIEASGMANPGPIASVFWLDDELQSRIRLDGIVTIVDAYHIHSQLQETEEANQQVAYADRILINKCDLLDTHGHKGNSKGNSKSTKTTLDQVIASIRAIHPTAPIQTTTYSQIPNLDWILDAQCFGGKDRLQELDRLLNEAPEKVATALIDTEVSPAGDSESDNGHNHDHDHSRESCEHCLKNADGHHGDHANNSHREHHRHTSQVSTMAIQHKGSLDLAKMNTWLAEILWPNQDAPNQVLNAMLDEPDNLQQQQQEEEKEKRPKIDPSQQTIFRIKGILSVQHSDTSLIDDCDVQKYLSKVGTESTSAAATCDSDSTYLDSRRYIVQAVHDLWDIHPASDDLQWTCHEVTAESDRICKLVIIGRSLKQEDLRAGFLSCFG